MYLLVTVQNRIYSHVSKEIFTANCLKTKLLLYHLQFVHVGWSQDAGRRSRQHPHVLCLQTRSASFNDEGSWWSRSWHSASSNQLLQWFCYGCSPSRGSLPLLQSSPKFLSILILSLNMFFFSSCLLISNAIMELESYQKISKQCSLSLQACKV